ncbi:hypothetical protein [Halalkalicoccus salilacus]|uniref:hypothetical protein n=1 Tax=Halalkalicoccus TaxID=332246 RepID=UPI002F9656BF
MAHAAGTFGRASVTVAAGWTTSAMRTVHPTPFVAPILLADRVGWIVIPPCGPAFGSLIRW